MAHYEYESELDQKYAETYPRYNAMGAAVTLCDEAEWSFQYDNNCYPVPINFCPFKPDCPSGKGGPESPYCCCEGGWLHWCGGSPAPSSFVPAATLAGGFFPLDNSGGCSNEMVNLTNGNLFVHYPVVSLPTKGYPLGFAVSYNTFREDTTHYGFRWRSTIERSIEKDDDGCIWVTEGTGRAYKFVPFGGGEYKLDDFIDTDTYYGTCSDWMNTTLKKLGDEYIEYTPFGKEFHYHAYNGRIFKISDPSGNHVHYQYKSGGKIVRYIHDGGAGEKRRQIKLDYIFGKLEKVTDPYLRETTFHYKNTYLWRIVGPEGCVTTFEYDENHRIKSKTNPNGGTTYYNYNADGRLISVKDPLGGVTSFEYDFNLVNAPSFKAEITVTDTNGKQWKWIFNKGGHVEQVTDPDGNKTRFVWNKQRIGRIIEGMVYDQGTKEYVSGTIHCFIYNDSGHIAVYIDPEGRATSFDYNSKGDVIKVQECRGSYRPRGDFEEEFGKDGFLLCAYDNSGEEDTDVVQLPDYVDSIEYEDDFVIRTNDGQNDCKACLYYSEEDERRYSRWYIASGSDDLDTFDINVKIADSVSEDKEFDLAIYSHGYWGETVPNDPLCWHNRRMNFTVSDSSGARDYTVDNTFTGVWTRFPVTGQSGSDVKLNLSVDLDESANIALSALAFDSPGDSKVEYEYDSCRNLAKIIDAERNEASYDYDVFGLLETATDFEGNDTQFVNDYYGNVEKIISPMGTGSLTAETRFEYDPFAHSDIMKITDPNGNVTEFEYDFKRRLQTITFPEGGFVRYFYDNMDNITKIKDSKGRDVVEYYYDIANRLTKKMYATGAQIKYEYDAAGNITKVIDPKDAETLYEYYDNNWLKKVTFPDGNNVFYEYSESGDLTKVTLPDGGEIQYEYFLDHSLKKVTLPDESTRSVEYDFYGNIYRLTDGRGKNVRFKYDTLQQLDETKRSLSGVDKITGYEYNKNGDLIKVTDARGNYTQFHYDKAGNISKIEYPDNTSETFQYDGSGNLAEHKDGKGKTTHFIYDSDDRLEEVRVPNGDSVNYYYDKNGNITKRGDHFADETHSDTATHYKYDSNDRLQEVKSVESSGKVLYQHKFAYDITNLTTEFSDIFGEEYNSGKKYGSPNIIGQSQGENYDNIYKFSENESGVKPLKYGGGNLEFKYGELPLGEPGDIPSGDGNGGDQNGGDQGDGEGSKTNIPGRIKYGMGEKKSEFTYDNLNRLTEYTDFFGNKFYYGYDRYSRLALVKYPNNILTGYTYDEAGRLDSITHKRGSGDVLRSCGYQYDANGNITKIRNEDYSYIEYAYDDWNRLTRETWKNAVGFTTLDIQYSYNTDGGDKYGDTGNICKKIASRNGGSPETTTFSYDAYNKLTSITHLDSSTETLTYDNNGQLTKRQKSTGETTEYHWNDQEFLIKVVLPSGEPVEYKYDGIDRLIGRSDAENDSVFIQSGFNIMMELDENKKRTYYTGTSEIEDGGDPRYFHYNHRGDTVIITDNEGNILHEINYEAYGEPTDSSGEPINPWGGSANSSGVPVNPLSTKDFPGLFVAGSGIRYDCKTNLQYMRYRWFSQDQMRFISPDLLMGRNRYSYVSGNPVSFIDKYGLQRQRKGFLHWWAYESHVPGPYGRSASEIGPIGYNPSELHSWGDVRGEAYRHGKVAGYVFDYAILKAAGAIATAIGINAGWIALPLSIEQWLTEPGTHEINKGKPGKQKMIEKCDPVSGKPRPHKCKDPNTGVRKKTDPHTHDYEYNVDPKGNVHPKRIGDARETTRKDFRDLYRERPDLRKRNIPLSPRYKKIIDKDIGKWFKKLFRGIRRNFKHKSGLTDSKLTYNENLLDNIPS